MASFEGELSPQRIELEEARHLHREFLHFLRHRLLTCEREFVLVKFLVRINAEPDLTEDLDQCQAVCKGLRRELARQFRILATLGLSGWAHDQKRALLRDVLAVRREAWVEFARIQTEFEAEEALAQRIEWNILSN